METYLSSLGRIMHGACAGMVGGFAASWVMNQYMSAQHQPAPQASTRAPKLRTLQSPQEHKRARAGDGAQADDATVKTAQAISRRFFDHDLSPNQKKIAGPAVHYAYGTLVGGLYGAAAEVTPFVSTGFGMLYGMGLWFLGDEAAVPALRLGPPPTQVPARKHADFLGAHLVFGIALDLTRRMARHIV